MDCIHENEVNKIAEFNLLHDIINPSKTHTQNIHHPTILHVCIYGNYRVFTVISSG